MLLVDTFVMPCGKCGGSGAERNGRGFKYCDHPVELDGRSAEAETAFRRAIELAPESSVTLEVSFSPVVTEKTPGH